MMTLIYEGGVLMWVLLALGLVALVAAARAAYDPARSSTAFAEEMARATLYATLSLTTADVGATLHAVVKRAPPDERLIWLVQGLGESTSPAIVGFSTLAMVAMLLAIARRRGRRDESVTRLS